MQTVMLFELKGRAIGNAPALLNKKEGFFYWNEKKFKKLSINDIVFVVNRSDGYVLYCRFDKVNIITKYSVSEDVTKFKDENLEYEAEGKWENFIRLKILEYKEISPDWSYNTLGAPEHSYFFIDGKKIKENNIIRIKKLLEIFDDEESQPHTILQQILAGTFKPTPESINSPKRQSKTVEKVQKSEMISQVLTAIQTKPFILLAGISGTGKSRLVRTLAYKTCWKKELQKEKPENFELIPVRPNWHDSSELLGYTSRISGTPTYITTKLIRFLVRAGKHADVPFFLCLDEMNLAPVEQYFAEFLSILETRERKGDKIISDALLSKEDFSEEQIYTKLLDDLGVEKNTENWHQCMNKGIVVPPNVVIMGTVNMDETTHSFSRKVLDRAMTIEMNEVDLYAGLDTQQKDWDYPTSFFGYDEVIGKYTSGADVYQQLGEYGNPIIDYLKQINEILDKTPFKIAYRVRDEFLIYAYYKSLSAESDWLVKCLDEMTVMKILSRIEGDVNRTEKILQELSNLFDDMYPKSLSKVEEMTLKLESGYTSFWS